MIETPPGVEFCSACLLSICGCNHLLNLEARSKDKHWDIDMHLYETGEEPRVGVRIGEYHKYLLLFLIWVTLSLITRNISSLLAANFSYHLLLLPLTAAELFNIG